MQRRPVHPPHALQPAGGLFPDQSFQSVYPRRIVVQTGNVAEFAPACGMKSFTSVNGDFLHGFQTVADEGGTDDVQSVGTVSRQADEKVLYARFQTASAPEAALEGDGVFLLVQTECGGEQAGGFAAFVGIGVAPRRDAPAGCRKNSSSSALPCRAAANRQKPIGAGPRCRRDGYRSCERYAARLGCAGATWRGTLDPMPHRCWRKRIADKAGRPKSG